MKINRIKDLLQLSSERFAGVSAFEGFEVGELCGLKGEEGKDFFEKGHRVWQRLFAVRRGGGIRMY